MRSVLIFLLAFLSVFTVSAQNPADSARIYFRAGYRQFEPSVGSNREAMTRFIDRIKQADSSNDIDHIEVRAYASPDGQFNANNKLTGYRCDELTRYIINETGISPALIKPIPEGIAWGELRRLIAATPPQDLSHKDEILNILDNTPVWIRDENGQLTDGRKKRLMQVGGGKPWHWMMDNIFPQLRSAVAMSLYLKSDIQGSGAAGVHETGLSAKDIADANPLADTGGPAGTDSAAAAEPEIHDGSADFRTPPVHESAAEGKDPVHRFALKTNLLYYAALMPNIELQWRVDRMWTLSLEGNVAWWDKASQHKYYQAAMISPEVRRWISPRGEWHGMYVGVFGSGAWYDLENGGMGYRGEAGMAGLSFGYMWPIGRRLSLEAGLGAGYMYTRYKEYVPYDGHYLYQRTKDMNYFGPLKLKFVLSWRFNDINKSKKNK